MKKLHFILFFACAILCVGCNSSNEPESRPVCDFGYYFVTSTKVNFTSTSDRSLFPYRWDFGDGTYYDSSEGAGNVMTSVNTITHNYAQTGSYQVRLSCLPPMTGKWANGRNYYCTKWIVVR